MEDILCCLQTYAENSRCLLDIEQMKIEDLNATHIREIEKLRLIHEEMKAQISHLKNQACEEQRLQLVLSQQDCDQLREVARRIRDELVEEKANNENNQRIINELKVQITNHEHLLKESNSKNHKLVEKLKAIFVSSQKLLQKNGDTSASDQDQSSWDYKLDEQINGITSLSSSSPNQTPTTVYVSTDRGSPNKYPELTSNAIISDLSHKARKRRLGDESVMKASAEKQPKLRLLRNQPSSTTPQYREVSPPPSSSRSSLTNSTTIGEAHSKQKRNTANATSCSSLSSPSISPPAHSMKQLKCVPCVVEGAPKPEKQTSAKRPSAHCEPEFAYREVVRNKQARQALPGHTCERCGRFVEGLIKSGVLDAQHQNDFLGDCSRHKDMNPIQDTPENFWELSFVDSIEGRLSADV